MPTLHIYLDESGDFDFSPTGTKYYIFSVAWTFEPKPLADSLTSLRFQLLKQGYDIQGFHATADEEKNRNSVVSTLLAHNGWKFTTVLIEKAKVYPPNRKPNLFYAKYATMPLKFVLKGQVRPDTTTCMIITDSIPVNKHKKSVEKAIKKSCRSELPPTIRFHCYHHSSASNKWLQVVDYCCWAMRRKWEKGDNRTYDRLRPKLAKRELDVLAHSRKLYY